MLAYSGYLSTSYYLATERKRIAEQRAEAARNRAAHRKLDRRMRLLADLKAVDKKLRVQARVRFASDHAQKRCTTLFRRRNKIVDMLNATA